MPKISVIMSIYKEPVEWVRQSIDSILAQTFSDFEFIIVNDRPDRIENTELLNEYKLKDCRIVVLANETNIGLTKSLNRALDIATGVYIARMDADDISLSHRFQTQVDYLDMHPEICGCGSWTGSINEAGERMEGFGKYETDPQWIRAQFPSCLQKHVLKDMVSVVSSKHGKQYEQTIIESHHDKTHLWGEILAKELHAKHICFNCNELFRGPDKYFEPYLAFFEFKYRRKELYGITEISVSRLFDGYNGLNDLKEKNFKAKTPDSVQDVSSAAVDELPSADWSICYIGRILKSYVDNILRDVALFAQRHTDKKINFIPQFGIK